MSVHNIFGCFSDKCSGPNCQCECHQAKPYTGVGVSSSGGVGGAAIAGSAYRTAEQILSMEFAIQQVRKMHQPLKDYTGIVCSTCDKTDAGFVVLYPCPTIKALDDNHE